MRTFPEKKKTEEVVLSKFILLYSSLFFFILLYSYKFESTCTVLAEEQQSNGMWQTHTASWRFVQKTRVPDRSGTDSIEKDEI